ncbi:hypothetical protein ACFQVA_23010 [Actinomadura keratinilytica]
MNHTARRIGRSLALVLPVVLVLSGTFAVSHVNWSGNPADSVLTASSEDASVPAKPRAAHDVLRDKLLLELQEKDPGEALTSSSAPSTASPRSPGTASRSPAPSARRP